MSAVAILCLTLLASTVGAITGFGSSTIMVPVLGIFFPLPVVLLFAGIIHLSGNLWKVLLFRRGIVWKIVFVFGIAGFMGSHIGARLVLGEHLFSARRMLGIFLVIYVFFLFKRPRWKISDTWPLCAVGGLLSGLSAGFFGVGGAVRSAFLTAFDLPKETYIFTSAIIALCIDISRISTYLWGGTSLPHPLGIILLLCIPVSLGGTYLGKRMVDKTPQHLFRYVVGSFLAIIGVLLVLHPQLH